MSAAVAPSCGWPNVGTPVVGPVATAHARDAAGKVVASRNLDYKIAGAALSSAAGSTLDLVCSANFAPSSRF